MNVYHSVCSGMITPRKISHRH